MSDYLMLMFSRRKRTKRVKMETIRARSGRIGTARLPQASLQAWLVPFDDPFDCINHRLWLIDGLYVRTRSAIMRRL